MICFIQILMALLLCLIIYPLFLTYPHIIYIIQIFLTLFLLIFRLIEVICLNRLYIFFLFLRLLLRIITQLLQFLLNINRLLLLSPRIIAIQGLHLRFPLDLLLSLLRQFPPHIFLSPTTILHFLFNTYIACLPLHQFHLPLLPNLCLQ